MDELLKATQAASLLGVSYPTLKKWIYAGKVRSLRTPGGHHRIPASEIRRLTRGRAGSRGPGIPSTAGGERRISGRNRLHGTISAVRFEGLLAEILLDIGGQTITAIITRESADEMGLRAGMAAGALIKATGVMIVGAEEAA